MAPQPLKSSRPTSRQLSYLRSLANQTGQTFTYPQTKTQASAEIQRLTSILGQIGLSRHRCR